MAVAHDIPTPKPTQQDTVPGPQPTLVRRVPDGDGYRCRDRVADVAQVAEGLLARDVERAVQRIEGHLAGLVEDDQIDVVDRQSVSLEDGPDLWRHRGLDEREDAGAVHVDVLEGADAAGEVGLGHGRLGRPWHPTSTSRDDEHPVVLARVTRTARPRGRGPIPRRDPCRRRAVPEQRPRSTVPGVDVLGVGVGGHQQHITGRSHRR